MEKAIKNKVAKAVVPAIDVMFQALRSASYLVLIWSTFALFVFWLLFSAISHIYMVYCFFDNFLLSSEFGAKVVPPKKVLKMLPELFDHPDQNVRASAKGVTLELCRWIGKEPVKSILFEKMRDTMVTFALNYVIIIVLFIFYSSYSFYLFEEKRVGGRAC